MEINLSLARVTLFIQTDTNVKKIQDKYGGTKIFLRFVPIGKY